MKGWATFGHMHRSKIASLLNPLIATGKGLQQSRKGSGTRTGALVIADVKSCFSD